MGSAIMLLLLLPLLSLVSAQDTYYCPDGWMLEEDRSGCRCFLIGPDEQVTKSTANLVCAGHEGWVAELDHPGINYWLKAQLLEAIPVGEYAAFWLGGTTQGHHSDHYYGEWLWRHRNATIEWFDWADNQPDDDHQENCLTLWEQHDPFFPVFRDYFWNDYGCDEVAHYICEKTCASY